MEQLGAEDNAKPEAASLKEAVRNEGCPAGSPAVSANNRVKLLVELAAAAEETYDRSDPEWLRRAECYVAGIAAADFFETADDYRMAKETCGRCEIAGPCLKYALDNREKEGVWGGADASERRMIRTKLRQRSSSGA